VDTGSKNIEICVLEPNKPLRILNEEETQQCIDRVEGDKKREADEKKKAAGGDSDVERVIPPPPPK
jgi:hypothetical protein